MLVKHLISELQKCPQEIEVKTEGCDCNGETANIVVRDFQTRDGKSVVLPYVYIMRERPEDAEAREDEQEHNGCSYTPFDNRLPPVHPL